MQASVSFQDHDLFSHLTSQQVIVRRPQVIGQTLNSHEQDLLSTSRRRSFSSSVLSSEDNEDYEDDENREDSEPDL